MRKNTFILLVLLITKGLVAQTLVKTGTQTPTLTPTRALTKIEADTMNKIELAFLKAFPKSWKDWKVEPKLKNHTVKEQVSIDLGKKLIHTYSCSIVYAIPNEMVDVKMGAAMKRAAMFADSDKDIKVLALGMKTTADCKVTITVESNLGMPYHKGMPVFSSSYCNKTTPQKISVSDTLALAVMGFQPGEIPILKGENALNTSEAKELDTKADYSDEALIFIGPSASALKKTTKVFNGMGRISDSYFFDQETPNMSSFLIYNIFVRIQGNSSDIDEFIKKIDWHALKKMIRKHE